VYRLSAAVKVAIIPGKSDHRIIGPSGHLLSRQQFCADFWREESAVRIQPHPKSRFLASLGMTIQKQSHPVHFAIRKSFTALM
jgi:hypothetical protein